METPPDNKRIERVGLACAQCRARHVKCDSTQPICKRCQRDEKECTYQKSRRGGLDKAALARRRLRLQQEDARTWQSQNPQTVYENGGLVQSPIESPPLSCPLAGDSLAGPPLADFTPTLSPLPSQPDSVAFQVSNDRLLELYFENFWPQFPLVLPLHYLKAREISGNHGMDSLLPVLYWIGAIFAPWTPPEPHFAAAFAALDSPTLAHTPFNVQALMLYAIALHHCDVKPEARDKLDRAVAIALELQMNEREFARAYGEGNPVLEESWRRTYYLLTAADQNFSIISNSPTHGLLNIPNNVDLPCDDEFFETGVG